MDFSKLDVPPIDEGSCLLRSYGLPEIRQSDKEAVIFHYSSLAHPEFEDNHVDGTDGREEKIGTKLNIRDGWTGLYVQDDRDVTRIKPECLPAVTSYVVELYLFIGRPRADMGTPGAPWKSGMLNK